MPLILVSTLMAGATGCQRDARSDPSQQLDAASQKVSVERFRADMESLASDAMRGREAGTSEHLGAAHYVAAEFRRAGLSQLTNEDYFQLVPMLAAKPVPEASSLLVQQDGAEDMYRFGDDYVVRPGFASEAGEIHAPLSFVGYGIRAAEYAHDDYAGIDVAGRIVLVLSGAPPSFATDQRAFYSSLDEKRQLAVAHGAVGILFVRTPPDQERTPWSRVLAGARSVGMHRIGADGQVAESFPELRVEMTLSDAAAVRLFDSLGIDLAGTFAKHASGQFGSEHWTASATLRSRSEHSRATSPNVLGMLRGSDPKLVTETILLTAHLDHIGIRPSASGDSIHNGAYDNAAGVATILEVARAVAALQPAPRRSLLFAAVTAEEKGLQGSAFLAENFPVGSGTVVANLNIDMPYLGFDIADVEGLGVEHSSLEQSLQAAVDRVGVALTADTRPEQVRFIRSDQFSFVKKGIPGLNLKPGSACASPECDGTAQLSEFLRVHYHQPSDDLELPFNAHAAHSFVQVALAFVLMLANDDATPSWNEDDFFGERFSGATTEKPPTDK